MPHDANGNLLKDGDSVTLVGKVTNISTTEDYCNCTVEIDIPMPPDGTKSSITLNTKQVFLSPVRVPAEAPAEAQAEAAPAPEAPPEEAASASD